MPCPTARELNLSGSIQSIQSKENSWRKTASLMLHLFL
ncbi:hypothetical protein JCM19233_31 [Vibrio astriarenae]|nr:hypothetical protein JCM19233_31 [Vibrio sp. C7]